MSGKRKEWEDDGRTVADMSGLDRPPLFGHKEGGSRKKQQEASDGDYVPPLSRGDRWAFLLGTMKAVSYTHLTLPTSNTLCRSRWSPYH